MNSHSTSLEYVPTTKEIKDLEKHLMRSTQKRTSPKRTEVTEYHIQKARVIDELLNINFLKNEIYKRYLFINSLLKDFNKSIVKVEKINDYYILVYQGNNEDTIEKFNILNMFLLHLYNEISKINDKTLTLNELNNINTNTVDFLKGLQFILNDIKEEISKEEEISKKKLGGKSIKYKSTGIPVYILYKNKKYNRTIYVKDKGNTKYCKIKNEYILLSKLKVIE
jgi:hypothetical protein